MPYEEELENHIEKNERAIEELSIRIEALDRAAAALFEELQVTPEQITAFLGKQENFTESNWVDLQQMRQKQEEKLMRELLNISNPKKTKKTFNERRIPQHWLYVR